MIENKISKRLTHNSYYAGVIKNLFGGSDSETNYFLQFLYYSYITTNLENEVSALMYNIAQDDIDHHAMLADCILCLGGDPIYASSSNVWFSGKNVDYLKSTKQIILIAIEMKEKSIIDYKTAISKIPEKEIKNVLEIILADERKHKEQLESLQNKYNIN